MLAEIVLRIEGNMKVYSEMAGNGYISPFTMQKGWYHHWIPNDTFTLKDADFTFPYQINREGLREKNYPEKKPDSTLRILVTGDSFAEGVGAPYDSTWPRLLEKYLREKNLTVEVIDGGTSGSDLIFDYVFYRDILKKYHPDLVIGSMNCGDYTDYYFRGGMERFWPDSNAHCITPPFTEYIYHYSCLFRAFYAKFNHPVKGIYLNQKEYLQFLKQANRAYAKAMDDYNLAARSNDAKFIGLLYAMPTEIVNKTGVNDSIERSYLALGQMIKNEGVSCLIISDGLNKELGGKPESYYTYPHDKHYNPTGYAVFARIVADSLMSKGIQKP